MRPSENVFDGIVFTGFDRIVVLGIRSDSVVFDGPFSGLNASCGFLRLQKGSFVPKGTSWPNGFSCLYVLPLFCCWIVVFHCVPFRTAWARNLDTYPGKFGINYPGFPFHPMFARRN
jgi:predicted Co/Zn/Cd cation transporter (cation efflux family)